MWLHAELIGGEIKKRQNYDELALKIDRILNQGRSHRLQERP